MTKKEFQDAMQKSWIEGWNERKLFEQELLDAIKNGISAHSLADFEQIVEDFNNDGARFLPEEEQW